MNYKIITCRATVAERVIQTAFSEGWQFVSMSAEHVAVSTDAIGQESVERGLIIFILSRNH
jgi:hypothetical protein